MFDRRIQDEEILKREIAADRTESGWGNHQLGFSTNDARHKLQRIYPSGLD